MRDSICQPTRSSETFRRPDDTSPLTDTGLPCPCICRPAFDDVTYLTDRTAEYDIGLIESFGHPSLCA
eukprot:4161008-Lingulodinium_polyedra.AAC.1